MYENLFQLLPEDVADCTRADLRSKKLTVLYGFEWSVVSFIRSKDKDMTSAGREDKCI
jgi:hypothetical protein